MEYSEYIKDESYISKWFYNVVFFHCKDELDKKLFKLCFEFAQKLSKHENTHFYKLAQTMQIIPANYVLPIILFAKKENPKFSRNAKLLEGELQSEYTNQFLQYSKKKQAIKLVKPSQADFQKCLSLEKRMFDLTERMYIIDGMKLDPFDTDFKEPDTEEKRQLREIKIECQKNSYFRKYRKFLKDKFEEIILDAEAKLQELNASL